MLTSDLKAERQSALGVKRRLHQRTQSSVIIIRCEWPGRECKGISMERQVDDVRCLESQRGVVCPRDLRRWIHRDDGRRA